MAHPMEPYFTYDNRDAPRLNNNERINPIVMVNTLPPAMKENNPVFATVWG
jgi:hypothetical protein